MEVTATPQPDNVAYLAYKHEGGEGPLFYVTDDGVFTPFATAGTDFTGAPSPAWTTKAGAKAIAKATGFDLKEV